MRSYLFIILIYLFTQTKLSARSVISQDLFSISIDTFKPNQENIYQLYTKAIALIMQNQKVFDGPFETPIYKPKQDTIFVPNKLMKIPPFQKGKLDPFNLGKLYMLNCQTFYEKVDFPKLDHKVFRGSIFNGCGGMDNGNIDIRFSEPFQSENKLYVRFSMIWHTIFRTQIWLQYEYFIELEVCDDNTLTFKKLFACISDLLDERPYFYKMDELKLLDKNFKKIYEKGRKEIKYIDRYNSTPRTIYYYEIDLKDKKCK